MEHEHGVFDTDTHFIIDPITRAITTSSKKITLIQYDHNSERFTFELPRYVEQHDMSLCNRVEVHYLNVDYKAGDKNKGVYEVDDLKISGENVSCSWLISHNATQLVGTLDFVVRFCCVTDGVVDYAWNTAVYSGIAVGTGINASDFIAVKYADILAQWKAELYNAGYINASDMQRDIEVLRQRMDTFASLPSGSTTGDAELMDIRVGADGVTYENAGTAVREQFADVRDRIDETESHVWIQSVNRFNAEEQTENTIVPYYHGADGEATSIDSYHFTAPIPVKPNTQYTVGYVPPVNIGNEDVNVPWHNAAAGCFFYDKNGNFLMRTQSATFKTTADTVYIRFNYLRSNYYGLDLPKIKEVCMLVVGDALPDTFSEHNDYFLDDVVNEMRGKLNNWVTPPPLYYDVTDEVLTVVSKYTADKDLVTVLQKKGGNNIFDFYKLGTIDNETDIPSSDISSMTQYLGISTDCHAPFNVSALSNIDGDALDSSVYTGGNHAYDGIVTGKTSYIRFFADGREKKNGAGYAYSIKVVWENLVQAWNTVKIDGTGREVIKERHTMIFDGKEWKETIELFPLEDIKMSVWYGLQMYGLSSVYNHIQYVGGVNRRINDASVQSECGDNVSSKVIGYGENHKFEMEIDPSFDLGKRTMYSGTTGIFVSNTKCYFYIIRNQEMSGGALYSLKGAYRFLPV